MRMDLCSLKPVTVSAGEIAERGLFVDLGNVRNPLIDQRHGWLRLGKCVEIPSENWCEAAYGVCPGTAGVAGISVRRVARYSSHNVENRWNVLFGT